MNIKELKMLERIRHRKNFKEKRKQEMNLIGEKVKSDIQNMSSIQYKDIGDYQIPTTPSPEFSCRLTLSNYRYNPGNVVYFENEYFTPTRIKTLMIKRNYQELTPQESRELRDYFRFNNRRNLESERENNRNQRFYTGEIFKSARRWF